MRYSWPGPDYKGLSGFAAGIIFILCESTQRLELARLEAK